MFAAACGLVATLLAYRKGATETVASSASATAG
jgi:hypothetical protein